MVKNSQLSRLNPLETANESSNDCWLHDTKPKTTTNITNSNQMETNDLFMNTLMMNRNKLAKTNLTSHNTLTTGHYRSGHTHPSLCTFQDVGAANASIQGSVYQIFQSRQMAAQTTSISHCPMSTVLFSIIGIYSSSGPPGPPGPATVPAPASASSS